MSSLSEKSAFEAFARMEERIDQSERSSRRTRRSTKSLRATGSGKDFKALEKAAGAQDADFRLLQLKQQMGMLGTGPLALRRSNWVREWRASAPAPSAPAKPSLDCGHRQRAASDDGIETADVEESRRTKAQLTAPRDGGPRG